MDADGRCRRKCEYRADKAAHNMNALYIWKYINLPIIRTESACLMYVCLVAISPLILGRFNTTRYWNFKWQLLGVLICKTSETEREDNNQPL